MNVDLLVRSKDYFFIHERLVEAYFEDQELKKNIIIRNSEEKISLDFFCKNRGVIKSQNIILESNTPLGFIKIKRVFELPMLSIFIGPKFNKDKLYKKRNVEEENQDNISELKEYSEGDNLKRLSIQHLSLGKKLIKVTDKGKIHSSDHTCIYFENYLLDNKYNEESLENIMIDIYFLYKKNISYSLILKCGELKVESGKNQYNNSIKLLSQEII